jgi:hypothetical protein
MKIKHRALLWGIGLFAILYGGILLRFGVFGYLNGKVQPTYSAGTVGVGILLVLLGFLPSGINLRK